MPIKLTNTRDLQEERFKKDPAARERWERTTLARAVALAVIRYRVEHDLSQRALAKQIGMPHPHIARLELGEHNPSVEMLQRLAKGLGRRFIVAVSPQDQPDLPLPAGAEVLADVTSPDGTRLIVAVT